MRALLILIYLTQRSLGSILLPVTFLLPGLRRRFFLENKECTNRENLQASVCFQFASEGEFEQILPLASSLLSKGENIELVHSSTSVLKNVKKLEQQYPNQVKRYLLRLLNPFGVGLRSWMTAPKLVMCRYDFYPELLLLSYQKHTVLVWASLIKYRKGLHFWQRYYYQKVLGLFEDIYASTVNDQKKIFELTQKTSAVVDFRFLRIIERLQNAKVKIDHVIPQFTLFREMPASQKIILGSAWKEDLFLLDAIPKDILVFFAPHNLTEKNYEWLRRSTRRKVLRLHSQTSKDEVIKFLENKNQASLLIYLDFKGVLCELYTEFDFAYIGGGFGKSIHSVMEPFLAGCQVFTGPKVDRSTEFELIQEAFPQWIHKVHSKEEFANLLSFDKMDLSMTKQWVEQQVNIAKKVVEKLS